MLLRTGDVLEDRGSNTVDDIRDEIGLEDSERITLHSLVGLLRILRVGRTRFLGFPYLGG